MNPTDHRLARTDHTPWRYRASTLARQQFPALRWAIPGILPEGVTILAGKPTMGKSWLALDVCLAVAGSGKALSTIETDRGDVLYLALEDTARRLQSRLATLLGAGAAPDDLEFWTRCPTLDAGGTEMIDEWLVAHPEARLVVIDTLKRVRPQPTRSSVDHDEYAALMPLTELAHRRHVAILVIHHRRTAADPDPLDELSGGAEWADGLLVLRRTRGEGNANLIVVHREVGEQERALRFDPASARWSMQGTRAEVRMSDERRAILDLLAARPDLTPKAIAETLDRPGGSIRVLLFRLTRDGMVIRDTGRYRLPLATHSTLSAAPLPVEE